ncbi:MAG: SNF2-related protein [Methylococcaceae bacterium]|nr:SNF2-related protein [Methylococcaceae bacterium]
MMRIIEGKVLSIKTCEPDKITSVIAKSKLVNVDPAGTSEVYVNFGLGECHILKNLGFENVPSPIREKYDWPGIHKPFDHQRTTAEFFTLNRKAYCFSDLGTGKTLSAIWAADYLMKAGAIKRVLIIAPLSILDAAWRRELFKTVMSRTIDVAHGSREKRNAVINSGTEFVIINYDGIEICSAAIDKAKFDLIIIDEIGHYSNSRTKRFKTLNKLITPEMWVWGMTATPAAQSPTQAYGLARLMFPSKVPRAFNVFREKVQYKVSQFTWNNKVDCERTVFELLQPAIRFSKKECLDLPELTYQTREVALTPQQAKYYKMLKKEMLMEAGGGTISAANAAVLIGKLLQLSAGSCYDEDGSMIDFDISSRFNELMSVISETRNKVLVFAQFRNTIERLQGMLIAEGVPTEVIHGGVSVAKRNVIFDDFQNKAEPRVLVIQPQAASHGVTLTRADTTVWWGTPMSYEVYLQANGRTHRAGQKNPCSIVHLVGSDAEKKMLNSLSGKNLTQITLMQLFNDVVKS